jgi:penicillin-binding protein-related factor A (putative recombinase)
MKESQIQSLFGKKNTLHGVFELKLCKGKSIRWDSVKPHQIEALKKVKEKGLYHKITDSLPKFGHSEHLRFTSKKPFDCFYLKNTPSFVVVCFYIPRKQKTCYYIDIDSYLLAWSESTKKSYREEDAEKISTLKLDL